MFWVVLFCFVLPAQPLLDELDRCYQYGKVVWEQSWPGNRGMRMWRAQMDSDLQRSRCRGADFIPSPLLCHHCPTRCRDEHTLWEETFPFSPRWKKKKKTPLCYELLSEPWYFWSTVKKKKKITLFPSQHLTGDFFSRGRVSYLQNYYFLKDFVYTLTNQGNSSLPPDFLRF